MKDATDKVLLRTWNILVRIKEKEILNDPGDLVINYGDASESDLRIIGQFHQIGVLKVINMQHDEVIGSADNIKLKINQPLFNETYEFYREAFNQTSDNNQDVVHRINNGTEIKDQFGFHERTFFLKRIASPDLMISFGGKKIPDTFYLMSALIDYIKKHGQLNKNVLSVLVPRERIAKYVEDASSKIDVNAEWLKNTKSNLVKKIREVDNDNEFIEVGDYKAEGYPLKLVLPNKV